MVSRNGFTLIELLVVIAIIAVLSVVVVLSLNPAELLRQSRDANRLSDLSTLNSALNLYTTDQAGIAGFSLGNASSVYVSLPDSSSTCGTWNLPALPSGYAYNCVTAIASKNINNTGWIPVNFGAISGGAPFSILPLDGVNQSSTGLYYIYYSNGSQFELTAIPESQKQKSSFGSKPTITNYPDVIANGSNMTISPLWNASGLIGYWPMDEGMGSTTVDVSGNNYNGTLSATGAAWVSGKAGNGLSFNGSTGFITASTTLSLTNALTYSAWINPAGSLTFRYVLAKSTYGFTVPAYYLINNIDHIEFDVPNGSAYNGLQSVGTVPVGTWTFATVTFDQSGNEIIYLNGVKDKSTSYAPYSTQTNTSTLYIAGASHGQLFNGVMDDVRIYNRALSPAEIQALYNAEK